MIDQRIRTRDDAAEIAGRILDRHMEGTTDLNIQLLKERGRGLFIRDPESETPIPLITSCSGEHWRDQAVATLADILWQKRECWNESHPEPAKARWHMDMSPGH
jgi:hypothetical protein